MFDLTHSIYHDADKAREHLEAIHWPDGPICPHCGNVDPTRITKLEGKSTRLGVYKCNDCRKPFSVTVGTVFERSHIPLNKWVLASHLLASSKKGMSCSPALAYARLRLLPHRLVHGASHPRGHEGRRFQRRPAWRRGKTVQADETYIGKRDVPYVSPQRKGRPYTKSGKSAALRSAP
jgi:hypothetical protein